MKLRPGTALTIEITQAANGSYAIQPKLRVGHHAVKPMGKSMHAATEAEVWMAIEELAQDKLARLGLDKTK